MFLVLYFLVFRSISWFFLVFPEIYRYFLIFQGISWNFLMFPVISWYFLMKMYAFPGVLPLVQHLEAYISTPRSFLNRWNGGKSKMAPHTSISKTFMNPNRFENRNTFWKCHLMLHPIFFCLSKIFFKMAPSFKMAFFIFYNILF
jgi:hypothetical protein